MAHLNYSQRIQIAALIREGKSNAQIAQALCVHRSTVGREIQRNAESREKYVALYAHIEWQKRQTEAGPLRNKFGSRSKLFNLQEKRNKVYTYLSKSHAAFFIPFNYLRLEWSNDLLYSGPMDSHIYSISRVPDYRVSNIICLEATGVILPYEKKSGEKYIVRSGESTGLSDSRNEKDRQDISSERDWLSPRIKHGGKKDLLGVSPHMKHGGKKDCVTNDLLDVSPRIQYRVEKDLLSVSPHMKHGGKKDRVQEKISSKRDWLSVSPRVKHGVKKDYSMNDEVVESATFLYLLFMYDIHFTHPYFLIRIVPSLAWPSYSIILLALFPEKSSKLIRPKNS